MKTLIAASLVSLVAVALPCAAQVSTDRQQLIEAVEACQKLGWQPKRLGNPLPEDASLFKNCGTVVEQLRTLQANKPKPSIVPPEVPSNDIACAKQTIDNAVGDSTSSQVDGKDCK